MVSISFEYKKRPVDYHYYEEDEKLTRQLADKLNEELGDLLKAVVLFGSAVRGDKEKESDIDVLLIVNDLTIVFSQEVITSLRVIIENAAAAINNTFHITTMQLSEFWEYTRQGDPIIVNMLREGRAVYDSGFFAPVQSLLDDGKIRPSKEAVWAYYMRAPKTIKSAEHKKVEAIVDLYWSVIDSAHAALMHIDIIPGAPHQVADLLDENFVKKSLLDKEYLRILRQFYDLAKSVGHHKTNEVSGKDLDKYVAQAKDFVGRMKFLLEHEPSKLKQ